MTKRAPLLSALEVRERAVRMVQEHQGEHNSRMTVRFGSPKRCLEVPN